MVKKHEQEEKKNNNIITYLLLGLILLSLGITLISFQQNSNLLVWDEAAYLSNARSHLETAHYTEDFRFPLLEYIISFAWLFTGESILVAQLLMILFTLASTAIVFVIARKIIANDWIALSVTTMYALAQPILFWGFRVYNDIPSLLFALIALLLYLFRKRNLHDYLIGIFSALAFLMRFPAILIVLFIGVQLIIDKKFTQLKRIIIGGVLTLLPWLIYNTITYKNPVWDLVSQGAIIGEYATWQPIALFFTHIYAVVGLSLLLLIPFIIAALQQERQNKNWHLLIGIILLQIVFYAFMTKLKLQRYVVMLLPFLLIAIGLGARYLSQLPKKQIWRSIALVGILLLLLINSFYWSTWTLKEVEWIHHCEKEGAVGQSITYLQEHYPEGSFISSNLWTIYGYYGNYRVGSIWDTNMSEMVQGDNPDVIVHVKNKGLAYPAEAIPGEFFVYEASFSDICDEAVTIYKRLRQ